MDNSILIRRETTDIWDRENPVLPFNGIGIEIILSNNKRKIKIGDGETDFNRLPYFIDHELDELELNEIVDDFTINLATKIPAPDRVAMYNSEKGLKSGKIPSDEDDVLRLGDVDTSVFDATSTPTANKIVRYNEDAGLKSDKIPEDDNDVIRLEDFDEHLEDTTAHSATSTPTASRIPLYNSDKGLKSDKVPSDNNDVIRFLDFDTQISDIKNKLASLNGAYIPLTPYDFGKTLDVTDNDDIIILNTFAIANTPGASSMNDVLNDTVIINLFDNYEYVWNKDAAIWLCYENGFLTIASNNHLGVVKGTEPPTDITDDSLNSFIQVLANGQMKTIGPGGKVDTVNNILPDNNKNITLDYYFPDESWTDPAGANYDQDFPGGTFTVNGVATVFGPTSKISDLPVNATIGYFNLFQTTDTNLPDILIADVVLEDTVIPDTTSVYPTVKTKVGNLSDYIDSNFAITAPFDCVAIICVPTSQRTPASSNTINRMFTKYNVLNQAVSNKFFTTGIGHLNQLESQTAVINLKQGERIRFNIWAQTAITLNWQRWTTGIDTQFGHWDVSLIRIK